MVERGGSGLQPTVVEVPATHVDLLERPLIASLATVRPDGAPQVNPMWFVWEPDRAIIRMTHTNERHNFRCIQREPRVALSITDPADVYRYLQVRGVVEAVEPDPAGGLYQLLEQRYLGRSSEVEDRAVRVILTIRPMSYKVR